MKAETLHGLPVVSIADGTVVGHVEALYFDPRQRRLALLELTAAGQRARIPFATVHHVGSDAVTIPAVTVVEWLNPTSISPEQVGLLALGELVKLPVVDETGTALGKVTGVAIDPDDGSISEVRVHQGGVLGIGGTTHTLAGAKIRSASADLMVVATEEAPPPAAPDTAREEAAGPRVEPEASGGERRRGQALRRAWVISSSVKARSVSLLTFPAPAMLKRPAIIACSSGASTMATRSYCPWVQYSPRTWKPRCSFSCRAWRERSTVSLAFLRPWSVKV